MRKYLFSLIIFFSACNAISISSQQAPSINSDDTFGKQSNRSYPFESTKFVSIHPDRALRMNNTCTQVLRLNLVQKKGYEDTIIELKNRAILMGGNAVSLVSWSERGSKTTLLSNIYLCKGKDFHIHPHP